MNLDPKKVVVAMSGGVDSSVAALLMKQAGYEVIGIMLKLWDAPKNAVLKHASCCSIEDASDARRVADQLEIPFYVINSKERFQQHVINPFVEEYLRGRTPNPCAMCNDKVKFDFLFTKAFELGAHYVATGHYARRHWDAERQQWQLFKGFDEQKDQSYFLFSLGQKQLEHTLFPIGDLSKQEVRNLAEKFNLKTSQKPESQEICFVPDGNHGAFIEKFRPEAVGKSGIFLKASGETLGQHEGIHHYTVGQRRGTRVAEGERVYVKAIDPVKNTVTMAPDSALYQPALLARAVRWVHNVADGTPVTARIRHRHAGSPAVLQFEEDGKVRVQFAEPQRAIAPGQVVAFYSGEELLGGGWIERGLDS